MSYWYETSLRLKSGHSLANALDIAAFALAKQPLRLQIQALRAPYYDCYFCLQK